MEPDSQTNRLAQLAAVGAFSGPATDIELETPATELETAIIKINDAARQINSMGDYSRNINDKLYGAIETPNDAACDPDSLPTLKSLNHAIEAVNDACTYLNSQLTRQQDLV